jgi:hypothetical protein
MKNTFSAVPSRLREVHDEQDEAEFVQAINEAAANLHKAEAALSRIDNRSRCGAEVIDLVAMEFMGGLGNIDTLQGLADLIEQIGLESKKIGERQ